MSLALSRSWVRQTLPLVLLGSTLAFVGRASPTTAATPTPAELAARFAPTLEYTSGEPFFPIPRADYVPYTDLIEVLEHKTGRREKAREEHILNPAPTIASLALPKPPCLPAYLRCYWALKIAGVDIRSGLAGYVDLEHRIEKLHKPTVYWHAVPDGDLLALQYWFFYVFDYLDWKGAGNRHEGDWEQVTVLVPADGDGSPVRVGYSAHGRGARVDWSALPDTSKDGVRPLVFVALGSHANYPVPGRSRIRDCLKLCRDRADGNGRTLAPDAYDLKPLGRPVFCFGDYGSGNYVMPEFVLKRKINVAEPQTRGEWRDPVAWLQGTKPANRCPR
jgi:hypothetical protein